MSEEKVYKWKIDLTPETVVRKDQNGNANTIKVDIRQNLIDMLTLTGNKNIKEQMGWLKFSELHLNGSTALLDDQEYDKLKKRVENSDAQGTLGLEIGKRVLRAVKEEVKGAEVKEVDKKPEPASASEVRESMESSKNE